MFEKFGMLLFNLAMLALAITIPFEVYGENVNLVSNFVLLVSVVLCVCTILTSALNFMFFLVYDTKMSDLPNFDESREKAAKTIIGLNKILNTNPKLNFLNINIDYAIGVILFIHTGMYFSGIVYMVAPLVFNKLRKGMASNYLPKALDFKETQELRKKQSVMGETIKEATVS